MTTYAHAVRRFWWIVALGAVVAVAAMFIVSRSGTATYTSVSEVLVTSPQAPYVRISVTDQQAATLPGQGDTGRARAGTELATTSAPDVNTLVRAANLYPFIIESDLVEGRRNRMFGELEGVVSARAIFAVQNALRFDPSEIPIIQIAGTAASPEEAVRIAQTTTDAFQSWMRASQNEAGLAPRERIVIEQIRRPAEVFVAGGTPTSLVLLVGATLLFGFAALAVLLDRTVGGARAADASTAVLPTAEGGRRKTVDLPAATAQDSTNGAGAVTDSDPAQLRKGGRWA